VIVYCSVNMQIWYMDILLNIVIGHMRAKEVTNDLVY